MITKTDLEVLLNAETKKTTALLIALEAIRTVMWKCSATNTALLTIDKIARQALSEHLELGVILDRVT